MIPVALGSAPLLALNWPGGPNLQVHPVSDKPSTRPAIEDLVINPVPTDTDSRLATWIHFLDLFNEGTDLVASGSK
jgi:hypothetical protein